jgi:hypothetical protein
VQCELTANYEGELCTLDTHLNLARLDFKYPVHNPTTFLPGAKPDLTAKLLPLFWEVRGVGVALRMRY